MSAARDWMRDSRRRESYRPYMSDADLEVAPLEPVATAAAAVPSWVSLVVGRLNELTSLKDNWDSYGAVRPTAPAAAQLVEVLSMVMSADTPAPSIVPSPYGHFQAEWHRNGVDLEVEVEAPTKIFVSFSDASTSWDKELSLDFTDLVQAVRRVGRTP